MSSVSGRNLCLAIQFCPLRSDNLSCIFTKMQHYIGPACLTANVESCVEWVSLVAVNSVQLGLGSLLGQGDGEGEWSGNLFSKISRHTFRQERMSRPIWTGVWWSPGNMPTELT